MYPCRKMAVMIDGNTRIDYASLANHGIYIDNRSGHHDGARADLRELADARLGVNNSSKRHSCCPKLLLFPPAHRTIANRYMH
ncbi:hypothetical protein A9Y76_03410 [Ralstonia insidiosa]|uniref:Uncharacterized protein n=1 Tax=Ralstonia insidiosa TaxID=190721 RepID=A0A191ZU10_9RALS|nr:hypothetical protein A9Y76_03410 [Ralstonia insidiosa]